MHQELVRAALDQFDNVANKVNEIENQINALKSKLGAGEYHEVSDAELITAFNESNVTYDKLANILGYERSHCWRIVNGRVSDHRVRWQVFSEIKKIPRFIV